MNAGYSKTPLQKKLGIREGFKIKVFNEPDYYFQILKDLPAGVQELDHSDPQKADFIHYFSRALDILPADLAELQEQIKQNGMIWISWDKTKAKEANAPNGSRIRELALKLKLVDIKVCAFDDTWSGLKLVIRKELRK